MYQHVLVAIDVLEDTQPALDEALALCVAVGAKLTVLHVVTPYQYPSQWMSPALQLLPQYREQLAAWMHNTENHVQTLVATHRATSQYGGEVEVIVRQGSAAEGIADCATNGSYDLLVMAAHARRGLGRALLGSVTDAILRRVEIPVLVVRARK